MSWVDPRKWEDALGYGSQQIVEFSRYFEEPLSAAGFDTRLVQKEWRQFRNFARAHYNGLDVHKLWEKALVYKREEYRNLCLLAEIVLSLSASNSTVERAFSLLTMFLSDKRLSLKHATMNSLMIINITDKVWTDQEREDIIKVACDKYLAKRRGKTIAEPPKKTLKLDDSTVSDAVILSDSDDASDEASAVSDDEQTQS